jgi:NAD(P)-dependent dehydrogenase (short-subunit alcohol dehydrogenase family)
MALDPLDIGGCCAVVTGGGHGIGRALAEALALRGANVVVADVATERAERVAARIGGRAIPCDVGDPENVHRLVADAEAAFGPVEVFCSNAGITDLGPDVASTPEQVRRIVDVNLLAHVWSAQAVLPGMVARGHGALVQTISSAALITGPSGMGYTLTKHGALGFAEWVALNYAHLGIRVSCLCPNAVNTGMLGRNEDEEGEPSPPDAPDLVARLGDVVEPEECAEAVLRALDEGRFLALPHPRVGDSFLRKATDYDAWLARTARRLRWMRGENVDPSNLGP